MFYKQAKSGVGLIIREGAGRLTLSRESRNKAEEKSSLQTRSTIAEGDGDWVRPYRWANRVDAESQLHFDLVAQKVLKMMRRLLKIFKMFM